MSACYSSYISFLGGQAVARFVACVVLRGPLGCVGIPACRFFVVRRPYRQASSHFFHCLESLLISLQHSPVPKVIMFQASRLPRAVVCGLALLGTGVSAQNSGSITASEPASSTTSSAVQTHTVLVGKADHKFEPDVTQAVIGDIIKFQFYPTNHSVVRADYGYPCIPYEMTGTGKVGFSTGFHPVDAILDDVRSSFQLIRS